MDKTKLIPGFRFHPTDVELIRYFLKRKILGKKFPFDVIAEVDIYKFAPWDLPDKSLLRTGDLEWYFFCPRGKKYASGARMNRATEVGYWKTTGKDRSIQYNNNIVGMIKTLVFHTGKAPQGDRTDWVMHEFRLEDKELTGKGIPQDSYVICRVYQKEGPGPRNGAQYGKPFNEEDWDEEEEIDCVESVPIGPLPAPVSIQPITCSSAVANDVPLPKSGCIGLTPVSCLSGSMSSPCQTHPSAPSNQVVDNDILSMLDYFKEDDTLALNENKIETVNNIGEASNAEATPCLDSNEIFEELGDLDNLARLGEDGHDFSCGQNQMLPTGAVLEFWERLDFLELLDLETPFSWQTEQHDCSSK